MYEKCPPHLNIVRTLPCENYGCYYNCNILQETPYSKEVKNIFNFFGLFW